MCTDITLIIDRMFWPPVGSDDIFERTFNIYKKNNQRKQAGMLELSAAKEHTQHTQYDEHHCING